MPDLWVAGFAGPLDDLIARIHRQIERFAEEAGVKRAFVEIELVDGVRYALESLTPEPGYGFITIRPYGENDLPEAAIVPVGSIRRIELRRAEEHRAQLGFSVPRDR